MDQELNSWLHEFVQSPGFLQRYPYYAFILSRLEVVPDQAVDVMAVSHHRGRFYLHVNVDFFVRSPQFLRGVLLHEVHHIVMGHLTHHKFHDVDHPRLLTLAMEMSANEFIIEQLPGLPIKWQDFREFGIGAQQSTMERYLRLLAAVVLGRQIPTGDSVDDHIPNGLGRMSEPGNTDWFDDWADGDVMQLLDDAIESVGSDESLGRNGRLAGQEPGHWLEELNPGKTPPSHVDWKTALQSFTASIRIRLPTYSRPNRRFPAQIGVIPGRTYFAGTSSERQSMLIVIDTSGSMQRRELDEIARHLNVLNGFVRMTVVECDYEIQRVYPYVGTLRDVQGRGGTDLRPVFSDEFLQDYRVDGLIYFTDGYGPFPNSAPGITTLWILTEHWAFPCPWGSRALLRCP